MPTFSFELTQVTNRSITEYESAYIDVEADNNQAAYDKLAVMIADGDDAVCDLDWEVTDRECTDSETIEGPTIDGGRPELEEEDRVLEREDQSAAIMRFLTFLTANLQEQGSLYN